eukprot:gene5514-11110_t
MRIICLAILLSLRLNAQINEEVATEQAQSQSQQSHTNAENTRTDITEPLPNFICTLTMETMLDPVILIATGQTYERTAIEAWLCSNNSCPLSGFDLPQGNKDLIPNISLIDQAITDLHHVVQFERLRVDKLLMSATTKDIFKGNFLGRPVAVCVSRGPIAMLSDKECKILSTVGQHPNIVRFIARSKDKEGHSVMVLELAPEGKNLKTLMDELDGQGSRLSLGKLLTILRQIAEAVSETEVQTLGQAGNTLPCKRRLPQERPTFTDVKVIISKQILSCLELWDTSAFSAASQSSNVQRMKIYVKDLIGDTTTIECMPNDTIYDIKTMILEKEGIPRKRQRLILDCRQLEDSHALSDYNIISDSILHLILKLIGVSTSVRRTFSDSNAFRNTLGENILTDPSHSSGVQRMRIYVKDLIGRPIVIECMPSDTIYDTKTMLQMKEGIPRIQQYLTFDHKLLVDFHALSYYNIISEATFHLVLKLRGIVDETSYCALKMTIYVQSKDNSNVNMGFKCLPDAAFGRIQQLIQDKSGIVVRDQPMFLEEKCLTGDENYTLSLYEIEDGDIIEFKRKVIEISSLGLHNGSPNIGLPRNLS